MKERAGVKMVAVTDWIWREVGRWSHFKFFCKFYYFHPTYSK